TVLDDVRIRAVVEAEAARLCHVIKEVNIWSEIKTVTFVSEGDDRHFAALNPDQAIVVAVERRFICATTHGEALERGADRSDRAELTLERVDLVLDHERDLTIRGGERTLFDVLFVPVIPDREADFNIFDRIEVAGAGLSDHCRVADRADEHVDNTVEQKNR